MNKLALAVAAIALACPSSSVLAQEDVVLRFENSRKIDCPGEIVLGSGKGQPKEEWFRESGRLQVRNVETATLTPFLPTKDANTGAAVIVAPGGAFLGLAIEEEGYRVARWFSDHGIAAFVLKYRVLPTPANPATFRREVYAVRTGKGPASFRPPENTPPEALSDGQAALRYIRSNAAQYAVDPDRVGMMGFSAGAMTTMSVALANAPDASPAFIAPIYGRQDAVMPPANPMPLFIALATNDPLFWKGSTGLIDSWGKAGGKVEFHLFQNGGHGFGLGAAGTTTVDWMEGFRRWLEVNGMLNAAKPK
jgi:acetyl esterase/lipase